MIRHRGRGGQDEAKGDVVDEDETETSGLVAVRLAVYPREAPKGQNVVRDASTRWPHVERV